MHWSWAVAAAAAVVGIACACLGQPGATMSSFDSNDGNPARTPARPPRVKVDMGGVWRVVRPDAGRLDLPGAVGVVIDALWGRLLDDADELRIDAGGVVRRDTPAGDSIGLGAPDLAAAGFAVVGYGNVATDGMVDFWYEVTSSDPRQPAWIKFGIRVHTTAKNAAAGYQAVEWQESASGPVQAAAGELRIER